MEQEQILNINSLNTRIFSLRSLQLKFGDVDIDALVRNSKGKYNYYVSITQSHAIVMDVKRVAIKTIVHIMVEHVEMPVVEYVNEIAYEVDDLERLTRMDGENIGINNEFRKAIYVITLSTVRGILFEKLANTSFSKLYLPFVELDYVNKI